MFQDTADLLRRLFAVAMPAAAQSQMNRAESVQQWDLLDPKGYLFRPSFFFPASPLCGFSNPLLCHGIPYHDRYPALPEGKILSLVLEKAPASRLFHPRQSISHRSYERCEPVTRADGAKSGCSLWANGHTAASGCLRPIQQRCKQACSAASSKAAVKFWHGLSY